MKMLFEHFDQEYFNDVEYYSDQEVIKQFFNRNNGRKISLEIINKFKQKLKAQGLLVTQELMDYHITILDDTLMFMDKHHAMETEAAIDFAIKNSYDKLKEIVQYQLVHTILD